MCHDAKCLRHVIERPRTFCRPAAEPRSSFSHLVLFWAQIGDAWLIIALCSGRVTMGSEPWPARSLVRVSQAVKYTPNERLVRQHTSVRDGCCHCSKKAPVQCVLDEIYLSQTARCKQIVHNAERTKMKEMDAIIMIVC